MIPLSLPEPSPEARAHSERLLAHIVEVLATEGGSLPFSRFMELAMYAPGLGYYSAGATKFGAAGDFVTAPELGSLFARCVANAGATVLQAIGPTGDWLELGGGSGAFVVAALRRLAELDAVPNRYRILEPSADLRERQRERVHAELPAPLVARVEWLDRLPEAPWSGVLFANEVLDALPTTRFAIDQGEVWEEHVRIGDGRLQRFDRPADGMLERAVRAIERDLDAPFADGYRSELLLQLPWWLPAVTGSLQLGLALFIDYGYPRREFYLDQRRDGTLVCHYRHRAHNDPLHWPGLTDISSFVDFTAVAEAGHAAGFELGGYCSQAAFLFNNGLQAELDAAAVDAVQQRARNEEARRLVLPGEMGERFQAIALQRGVDVSARFAFGDRSERL